MDEELLVRYETLPSTLEVLAQHLDAARQQLQGLPGSEGRAGLMGLTDFLARQTEALGVGA